MVTPKVLVFLMEKIYGPETEIKKDEISHVWKEKLIQTDKAQVWLPWEHMQQQ